MRRLGPVVVIALGLAACSGPGVQTATDPGMITDLPADKRAERLLRQARTAEPNQRASLYVQAAYAYADAGQPDLAEQTLLLIDTPQLNRADSVAYLLLLAELEAASGRQRDAWQRLNEPALRDASAGFSGDQLRRYITAKAAVYGALGRHRESAALYSTLIDLMPDSRDPEGTARAAINEQLWLQVNRVPLAVLQQELQTALDPVLRGWYQLALQVRSQQLNFNEQKTAFENWQQRWPNHPATLFPPTIFDDHSEFQQALPSKIALLLPSERRYLAAANAIRDGLLAAYYRHRERGGLMVTPPTIITYDTFQQPATQAYQAAVAAGAELVIGPLREEAVENLLALSERPVPVITLNYFDRPLTQQPENIVQFGLSPTREVEQLAERAVLAGHEKVMIVAPNDGWGSKATDRFASLWQDRAGELTQIVRFPAGTVNHIPLLEPALQVDLSKQRRTELERLLGKKIVATPRRRDDIDLILFFTNNAQAQAIKPSLSFLFAGDIAVYGTSQLYAGTGGSTRELSGVEFPVMPWAFGSNDALLMDREVSPALRQFFALGADAYLIQQNLPWLQALPGSQIYGTTGTLQLIDGTIMRRQPWARATSDGITRAPNLMQQDAAVQSAE